MEDAHAAGVKVFTHTVSLAGAKIAAGAGVDVLAHGIGDAEVDAELIAIMKAKGTVYVPTLAVYEFKGGASPAERVASLLEPEARATLRSSPAGGKAPSAGKTRWQHLMANVKRLHDAGVPVALGTDAGMPGTFHGYSTLRELELLVQAGFTPLEAIAAGTGVSARTLGVEGQRGTITAGKVADLVLVEGRPDQRIGDMVKTRRVFLDGSELAPPELEKAIQSKEMTPLPAQRVAAAIDDMEGGGRTLLGTLRVNGTDSGADHSAMLMLPVVRAEGGHALLVAARMADKDRPYVRVEFPLTAGAIAPADLSGYTGVSFEVRGEAAGRLLVQAYHVRSTDAYAAEFTPGGPWQAVKVPFASLRRRAANSGSLDLKDARALLFELRGTAGSSVWMELDNVRFY
ncbi:MAG: CIA30 family protein [Candidatus Solibacter sp.]|nr:CIA30 family protein [Candidatus Solibacter sp.]